MCNLTRKTEKGLAQRVKRQQAAKAELERLAAERRKKAGLPELPALTARPRFIRTRKRDENGRKLRGQHEWFQVDNQGKRIPL
jgi:hypothetical protein